MWPAEIYKGRHFTYLDRNHWGFDGYEGWDPKLPEDPTFLYKPKNLTANFF